MPVGKIEDRTIEILETEYIDLINHKEQLRILTNFIKTNFFLSKEVEKLLEAMKQNQTIEINEEEPVNE